MGFTDKKAGRAQAANAPAKPDRRGGESAGRMQLVYGDVSLGVKGEGFHYIFSYQTGGLESLSIHGKEWLYRTPKPTFWRALTDNDRGCGFQFKSGMWLAADMYLACTGIEVAVDGQAIPLPKAPENNRFCAGETAGELTLAFRYEAITVPKTEVAVTYQVIPSGRIEVTAEYKGQEGLPELPVFGMRFVMPTKAIGYTYEGLSGETYPDRKAGAEAGIYQVEGLPVTPYLCPQDCGVHMDTKWLEIYRDTVLDNTSAGKERFSLRIASVGKGFAFSCLPYTAEELENAAHQEELPPARRTVLCVLGAVRGVGGIDSWGTDIEEPYRIDAQKDIRFSFSICGGEGAGKEA